MADTTAAMSSRWLMMSTVSSRWIMAATVSSRWPPSAHTCFKSRHDCNIRCSWGGNGCCIRNPCGSICIGMTCNRLRSCIEGNPVHPHAKLRVQSHGWRPVERFSNYTSGALLYRAGEQSRASILTTLIGHNEESRTDRSDSGAMHHRDRRRLKQGPLDPSECARLRRTSARLRCADGAGVGMGRGRAGAPAPIAHAMLC